MLVVVICVNPASTVAVVIRVLYRLDVRSVVVVVVIACLCEFQLRKKTTV